MTVPNSDRLGSVERAERIATYAYHAPDRVRLVEYARLEIEAEIEPLRTALREIAEQGPHAVNGKPWRHWSAIAREALTSVAFDEARLCSPGGDVSEPNTKDG